MSIRNGRFLVAILLVTVILITGTVASAQFGNSQSRLKELESSALSYVVDRYGLDRDRLTIATAAISNYPTQGIVGFAYKVLDLSTGTVYRILLDALGNTLDEKLLRTNELALRAEIYGKLDPALADVLTTATTNQPIAVAIWLKEINHQPPDRPAPDSRLTTSQMDAILRKVDAERAEAVAQVTGPFVRRLTQMGLIVTPETYSPIIYTDLTPPDIRRVASLGEVDRIYLAPLNEPELEVVAPTIMASTVHSRGYIGTSVKVAQVEVGGRIAASNPYLPGVFQDTTYVCSTASDHSTGVAGIIRSTNNQRLGVAYGAKLWAGGSCIGYSDELNNRSTAAADWLARAINLSWGHDTDRVPDNDDRFYDDMVLNRCRTIVKSAGNQAGSCGAGDGDVTSPGLAYNVITVGNFDDMNSTTWMDDAMNSCSSWGDPLSTYNDREKPELAAPGSNINSTTTTSPWTGDIGSGTSYAAPAVTGGAALLMQRHPLLQCWPEAVKAILMATAVHNIEGSSRLSEYDGAGAIALDRADNVARSVNGKWGGVGYSCISNNPWNITTMSLTPNVRTRVVIAWDQPQDYGGYAIQPWADLDINILNPSGTIVAWSASYDNTYEIVEYTPTASGTYTLQIARNTCDYSGGSWLGWAWYSGE